MRRRGFIGLLGGMAAWPLATRAQQDGKVFRIGFLGLPTADSLPQRTEAFRARLRDLGYQEGRNVAIEYRWADGHYERLPTLLTELIARKVDVIVTHGTPGALAAKRATTTVPIVIAVVGDAISSGIVSHLARPDANITGSTFIQPELAAKRLEILKEAMPNLTEVGVLLNLANPMNDPILPQMTEVANSHKLTLRLFDARSITDFDSVIAAMAANVGAFVLLDVSPDCRCPRDWPRRYARAVPLMPLLRDRPEKTRRHPDKADRLQPQREPDRLLRNGRRAGLTSVSFVRA